MAQPAGLAQRSISAVLWGASGSAVQMVLQFGIQIVLARVLGPDQYGLFALALVVITLCSYFGLNLVAALIQKRDLSDEDVRFVTFWQLAIGAAIATAVYLGAGSTAAFFHEPRIAPLLEAMAVVCLLQAAAGVPSSLLSRELEFKSIYLANIAGYAIGYGMLGIPLALAGYGVRALVVAYVVQSFLSLAALYWRKPPLLGLVLWHRDAAPLWRYGATVFATNLSNWALLNVGRAVVGRAFPSATVGLYALAHNLAMQLATAVTGAVQPPLFSASSRVQDDVSRLRPVFLAMVAATALLSAPLFAGMAAAAQTLTLALYGEAWAESAPLLRAFALAMPFYLAAAMATPMLWTSGRITQEYKIQLPIAAALALATYVAAQYSLAAAAWAACGIFALRFVVITAAACRALELGFGELAKALRAGIAVTAFVALAIALVDELATGLAPSPQAALALDVAAGFLAQLLALRLARPWFSAEAAALFDKLLAMLPTRA
jgi:O-antigen/teichoic acid export membrane protein